MVDQISEGGLVFEARGPESSVGATPASARVPLPRLLLRRWYLVALALVLTAAASLGAFVGVGPEYTSRAYVLFLPPIQAVPDGGNPLLAMGGMKSTVDVVARALGDARSVAELEKQGADAEFVVVSDPTTSGPVLSVTADSRSAASAQRTTQMLVSRVEPTLETLQDDIGVTPDKQIRTQLISADQEPIISRNSQLRLTIFAGVLGFVASVGLMTALDLWLTRRKTAQSGDQEPDQAVG